MGVLLQLFPPRTSGERRLVAILLASGSAFEELVPRRHRQPQQVAGFYQGCGEWDAIVARLSTEGRGPFASLDHEYAHIALNRSLPAQPLWAAEGLAELLSDAEFDGGEARLGAAEPELERRAREHTEPLTKLLQARPDSPEYLGASPGVSLYPSSWALARWVVARHGLAGLRACLEAVSLGQDPLAAFEERLAPLAAAQATLLEVPRGPLLRVAMSADASAPVVLQLDAPSRADLEYRLGELLLREGELARSQPRLERALAEQPDSVPLRISLAQLRLQSGEPALARRELERALAVSPDDPRALLYDARLRVAESRARANRSRRSSKSASCPSWSRRSSARPTSTKRRCCSSSCARSPTRSAARRSSRCSSRIRRAPRWRSRSQGSTSSSATWPRRSACCAARARRPRSRHTVSSATTSSTRSRGTGPRRRRCAGG